MVSCEPGLRASACSYLSSLALGRPARIAPGPGFVFLNRTPALRFVLAVRTLRAACFGSRRKERRVVEAPILPPLAFPVLLTASAKAGATRPAENGATQAQWKAMFDWTDDNMPALYAKTADRARMAASGMPALEKKGKT
jgi:hypothetical protein